MSKPFPKCISKGCPISERCIRYVDGEESQLVDYDRVDSGMGKCEWYIEIKFDNKIDNTEETADE